ncbi:UNKNOWN [Stylonychia lemnae]|uniref:Uncharacterized protein n=1 Tax=Stylonychia lemnae TaxID=5949 RepID=A0A077ZT42_STYLE|nr:UNKNOWN [Stylonychia lemnae]|eukprot:CDW72724.1 UNKNOWN [Stylonychia lemnae]
MPFTLTLKEKQDIQRKDQITHQSLISQTQICNIVNSAFCYENIQALFIDRVSKSEHMLKMLVDDKIVMLNQKFSQPGDRPVILKLTNHRIGVLIDFNKGTFDFDIFKKLNAINQILSSSKNCGVYSQEFPDKFEIFILRKLEDGRGNIWKVKIGKSVLQNIIKELIVNE